MADSRAVSLEITRKFLQVFHNNTVFAKNLNHEFEEDFGSQTGYDGQKIGPTLHVRDPIIANVRSGWTMTQQSVTETYHELTIDTPIGVDLEFSDAELATSLDDIIERYVTPEAKKLAAYVDKDCATKMAQYARHSEAFTSLAVPDAIIEGYLPLRAKLKNSLVPDNDPINVAVSPWMSANIVSGLAGQHNPTGVISTIFEKGQMARAAGLEWYESNLIPSITTGSLSNTTPVTGTLSTATPTLVQYTAGVSGGTLVAGQSFTIAGVFDINFETKTVYSHLKQWIVASSVPSTTTGVITITEAINYSTTSPAQNCYIAAGTIAAGLAIVFGCLNGVTAVDSTASTAYQRAIMWHKEAFAFASVPLTAPKGMDMATVVSVDNLSFRFVRGFDIANAKFLSRMDIFYGFAAVRPEWAGVIWTV